MSLIKDWQTASLNHAIEIYTMVKVVEDWALTRGTSKTNFSSLGLKEALPYPWLKALASRRSVLYTLFSQRDTYVHVRYMLWAVRLSSDVCRLSLTLVHPTQPVEIFGNFFSPYDSSGTLVFWCQNRWWGRPFTPEICVQSDPLPFKQRKFDQYRLITPQAW